MLASSSRADIAVGYFFMSGFQQVANDLAGLVKVRILVGRTDRRVLDAVSARPSPRQTGISQTDDHGSPPASR